MNLRSDQKNEVTCTSGRNEFPSRGGCAQNLERLRSSEISWGNGASTYNVEPVWGSSGIWSGCLLGAFLWWFTSPTSRGVSGVDCECKLVWSMFLYFCTHISVFLPQAAEDCVDPNISWWSNVVMMCIAQRQPVLLISLWWTRGLVFTINLMLILIF